MRHILTGPPATVPADRAKRVRADLPIDVAGTITDCVVRFSVSHTDPTDLAARLILPWGETVEIPRASIPQSTRIHVANGKPARGLWRLEVDDVVAGDGGRVEWSVEIETDERGPFVFEIEFQGAWSEPQKQACERGVRRVERGFTAGLEPARLSDGRMVESHLVLFEARVIDGPGGILGMSGPIAMRWENDLPIASRQTLDEADRDELHDHGELEHVVSHELYHGTGVGTIWPLFGVLNGAGGANPLFMGAAAMREYGALLSKGPTYVPVANTGGSGSRDSHWRESVFDHELMTPFFDAGRVNPISRVTLASLADLGYQVDLGVADTYALPPGGAALRLEGRRRCGVLERPTPVRIGGPS